MHRRSGAITDVPARAPAATFGTDFFAKCIIENATYPDGSWQAEFESATGQTITSVKLSDTDTVAQLSGLKKTFDKRPTRFTNRPEVACYSICQEQLGRDGCTFFTYDGLTKDACAPTPAVPIPAG